MEQLAKSSEFSGPQGPVVLVIMDGVGIGKYEDGGYGGAKQPCRILHL